MKYVLAILGGAAVGGLTALLFAPNTGRTTRARIRDKTAKYSHKVQDLLDKKSRHLSNKLKGYRHHAEKMAEQVQSKSHEVMDNARSALHLHESEGAEPSPTATS